MESRPPEADTTEPAPSPTAPEDATPQETAFGPTDPAALVNRLIEIGEWPDPKLLEQIAAAGEAPLGPLLDYIRTYPSPNDYQREIVLYNGIGILSMIHSPSTIPDLIEILKRYPGDSGELAAEVLGSFGKDAVEPLLKLLRASTLTGYRRQNAINAAAIAVGRDPELRARLADVLRPMLADAIERMREEAKHAATEPDEPDEDSEGWVLEGTSDEGLDDEDLEESPKEAETVDESVEDSTTNELEAYEELMFLISDIANLADPKARELIDTAFEEDLVETFFVDKASVEESYRKGGEEPRPLRDWFEVYRHQYRDHLDRLNRSPTPNRPLFPMSRPTTFEAVPDEQSLPPVETIRNTGPKLGRNDPCWCGSGKKYKKCHLGKDDRA
jgi:hypothetical protein